jgi:hypothetical protein
VALVLGLFGFVLTGAAAHGALLSVWDATTATEPTSLSTTTTATTTGQDGAPMPVKS